VPLMPLCPAVLRAACLWGAYQAGGLCVDVKCLGACARDRGLFVAHPLLRFRPESCCIPAHCCISRQALVERYLSVEVDG